MKTFKKVLFVLLAVVIVSCNNSEKKLEEQIAAIEKTLPLSDSLFNLYNTFCSNYPENPRAAAYLFRSAELKVKNNDLSTGAALFTEFYTKYPSDSEAPNAMFKAGVCYENFGELDEAHKAYSKLIAEFPESEYSKTAAENLRYLGRSSESILQEILMKAAAKDSTSGN